MAGQGFLSALSSGSTGAVSVVGAGLATVAVGGWVLVAKPFAPEVELGAVDPAPIVQEASVEIAPSAPIAAPEPVLQEQDIAPDIPEAIALMAPKFDVVRIEPDGSGLIAGTAEPGARISILLDGAPIVETEADGAGDFVAFLSLQTSDAPRVLSMKASLDGAEIASAQTVIVAPSPVQIAESSVVAEVAEAVETVAVAPVVAPIDVPENVETSEATPVIVAPEAVEIAQAETVEPDVVAEAAEIVVADVAEIETADVDPLAGGIAQSEEVVIAAELPIALAPVLAPEQPEILSDIAPQTDSQIAVAIAQPEIGTAPTLSNAASDSDPVRAAQPPILLASDSGVRLLQPAIAPNATPEVMANVALDTITYDPDGEVILAGRASSDGFVRIYLDNSPVTVSRISAQGNWRTDLPEVDTGVYILRIDQVDDGGEVVSRIETPFKREEPEVVVEAMAEQTSQEGFQVAVETVQAGSTLWAIAQERYGDGIMYVEVFEANKDRIRNPDLIYPGQIFQLPDIQSN